MKSLCPFVLALLLFPLPVLAQEFPDSGDYTRAAGKDLPLYRARVADVYGNRFNGTYLIDNEGFQTGDLCYVGKVYTGLLLHIDAAAQHVLVQQEGSPVQLDLGREQIDWFSRGGRKYVNLPARGYKVPEGFYEQVAEGQGAVYRRVDKVLQRLTDPNGSARGYIGYQDPNYKDGLMDYYNWKETWYQVKEDGSVKRLRGKRSVQKAVQYVRSQVTH